MESIPKCASFTPANRLGVAELLKSAQQPVVECAKTGFMLPENKARQIEALAKDLPSDFTYRRLAAAPSEFELPANERTDVSLITTDTKDRDGEVVLPQGGDWTNYDAVVPFAHSYKDLPVGINWWLRPALKGHFAGLRGKTHYPTKPADWDGAPWMSSAVLHLMQQPVPGCTGKSIGFLPLNIRSATAEEKSRRPEWKDAPIIDRWVGIEYSVAPVPANSAAQMEAVSKAFTDGAVPKEFADIMAKLLNVAEVSAIPEINEPTPEPPIDPEAVQKAARDAAIAAALAAPFYSADAYRAARQRQQTDLAPWAQSEAKRQIEYAIAAASGRV